MKYYKVMYKKNYTVAVFSDRVLAEHYLKTNKSMPYTLKEFEGNIYVLDKLGEKEE